MNRPLNLLLSVAAAILVSLAATGTDTMRRLETAWQDAALRWSGVRHWPEQVVLVTVDEPSLVRFRDDPLAFWTPHFARAAERLRQLGARTVGIDFLFSVSPEGWIGKFGLKQKDVATTYDAPLRQQIHSGQLILVASQSFNPATAYDDILLPEAGFLLSVPDMDLARYVALANLFPDGDGAVRRFISAPTLNLPPGTDARQLPGVSFAALLARHATGGENSLPPPSTEKQEIVYSGPPGTIPRISLSRLLSDDGKDDGLRAELTGKVAIIAGEFSGMGDVHATPYGARMAGYDERVMIGAEIQANIVEQLLAGLTHTHLPPPLRMALLALLALAGAVLGQQTLRGHPAIATGALLSVAATILVSAAWAMSHFVVMDVMTLILSLLLGFAASSAQALTPVRIKLFQLKRLFGERVSTTALRGFLGNFTPSSKGRESFPVAVLAISPATEAEMACEQASQWIRSHGGTVSSTEGHLVLGYFGWPIPTANPCADAVTASIALHRQFLKSGTRCGLAVTAGEVLFVWQPGMISAFGDAVGKACGMAYQARQAGQLWLSPPALAAARCAAAIPGVAAERPLVWADGDGREQAVNLEIL